MTKYLFKFTPVEPYFFGNEKTLAKYPEYDGKKNEQNDAAAEKTDGQSNAPTADTASIQSLYFASSEDTPSQSTILGAIRLMLLLDNGRSLTDFNKYSDAEEKLIGPKSFKPDEHDTEFGCIKSISPLFIIDGNDQAFIPMPRDHVFSDKNENYTPFGEYKAMRCAEGEKLYPTEYDPKTAGWYTFVSTNGGCIKDMISSEVRVGIKRKTQDKGFFKRRFKKLNKDYSFAVICELNCTVDEDGMFRNAGTHPEQAFSDWPVRKTAFLGRARSPFAVEIAPTDMNIEALSQELLNTKHEATQYPSAECTLVYCLSDAFVSPESKYKNVLFAATETRDHRSLSTGEKNGMLYKRKDMSVMHRLLKAGSVLVFENEKTAACWIKNNTDGRESAKNIGYNSFITVPKKEENKEEE